VKAGDKVALVNGLTGVVEAVRDSSYFPLVVRSSDGQRLTYTLEGKYYLTHADKRDIVLDT